MKAKNDIVPDMRIGEWTVIRLLPGSLALCRCGCGTERKVPLKRLRSGKSLSCGCKRIKGREKEVKIAIAKGRKIINAALKEGLAVKYFRSRPNKNSTTGITGVSITKNKRTSEDEYRAYIVVNGKQISLGVYAKIEDAAAARKRGEEKYFIPLQEKSDKLQDLARREIQEEQQSFVELPSIEKNKVKPRSFTHYARRKCVICGIVFLGGPRAKYCPNCREEIRKERDREQKRRGAKRPLGSVDICEACGKEYVVQSGLQKYCQDCAAEQIKARDRQRGKEYAAEQRELNPDRVKEWKRRKYEDIQCAVCGKIFTPETARKKTCSEKCQEVWRKYRAALSKWRYDLKHGTEYVMPTLEGIKNRSGF